MKLISKEVKIDPATFCPVVRLTVDVPIDDVSDAIAHMSDSEVKMFIGTKLFDALTK